MENDLQSRNLLRHLTAILDEVAQGNATNIETIFEMTKEGVYPAEVVKLAESFGMMIVNIEAKQHRLEQLMADLREKNRTLELLSADLLNANIGMLEVLGCAIAKRDSNTSIHNYRVSIYAVALGKALQLPAGELRSLLKGAFLHDIGKIAISDSILLKPAKLDHGEFEIIKSHVQHGNDIINSYAWLADTRDVVVHHHEKFNGTGYPAQLKAEAIPSHARIFAIADVFDALTSQRPYKAPFSLEHALTLMSAEVGQHFDPQIFAVFRETIPELYCSLAQLDEHALAGQVRAIMRELFELPPPAATAVPEPS